MKNITSFCIAALIASVVFVLPGYGAEKPAADAADAPAKETVFDPIPPRQPEFTGEFFSLKDVDTRPASKGTPASPSFPKELKKAGASGQATVAFVVSTEGVPGQIQVIQATHRGFGEAAAKCVNKWRFKPAIKDGKPVNCVMVYPIEFTSPL